MTIADIRYYQALIRARKQAAILKEKKGAIKFQGAK
jgi:hypothetical protein